MKITNKQFADKYLSASSSLEVLALFEVIGKLLSRHQLALFGELPQSPEFENLQAMIKLLSLHKKLSRTDINALTRYVKSIGGKEANQLILTTNNSAVMDSLQKVVQSDGQVDMRQSDQVGVMLQGEDGIYKRTLKTDLNKLLT